jgi:hypothetical protein
MPIISNMFISGFINKINHPYINTNDRGNPYSADFDKVCSGYVLGLLALKCQ